MMNRFPSGIYGLDRLIEGGFRDKTANVIVGSSGTGKTTFAIQFIMYGIENGEQGLYISLEEEPKQIMEEAALMGFDMEKYYEESLFFIHLKGENFKKMINEQLPALVKARSDYLIKTRIVVDPITPVIWATDDKLQQRELIGKLFYTVKKLGVVVSTVEEHARPGETIGEDVLTPVYLSDGVIHLDYYPVGGAFNRTLQILKMRGTKHGEGVYPFIFTRGAGIVVRSTPLEVKGEEKKDYSKIFDEAIETAKMLKASPTVIMKLENIKKWWSYPYSPEEIIEIIFDTYGLKVR